jgi:hypothetical protein
VKNLCVSLEKGFGVMVYLRLVNQFPAHAQKNNGLISFYIFHYIEFIIQKLRETNYNSFIWFVFM